MQTPPDSAAPFPDATRADIQGFITSGHKHLPHSAYLFIHLAGRDPARRWLSTAVADVCTAGRWRPTPREPKARPESVLNIAFTAEGFRALGLCDKCMDAFPAEFVEGPAFPDRARIMGDTGDSAPEKWQFGGPQVKVIHALVIASASTKAALTERVARIREQLAGAADSSAIIEEHGDRPAHGKEPFGFLDGIAQPEIRGIKPSGVRAGEFIIGHENEYGFVTPGPVLRAPDDPHGLLPDCENPYRPGLRDFGQNGSFIVYRKLAQDVAAFWGFMEGESLRLHRKADAQFMVWLAAKMLGRWPSGAPLVLAPHGDNPALANSDDFQYAAADPDGLACPLGSHIRRTNPRDHLLPAGPVQSLNMTARHRILRRGKPFGPELFDLRILDRVDDVRGLGAIVGLRDDAQERGLQFLCVNASIKGQFEFIQQSWANSSRFNGLAGNCDPLIGTAGRTGEPSCMHVPTEGLALRTAPMPRLVKVRAAAYFFMPGIRALRYLSQPV